MGYCLDRMGADIGRGYDNVLIWYGTAHRVRTHSKTEDICGGYDVTLEDHGIQSIPELLCYMFQYQAFHITVQVTDYLAQTNASPVSKI